MKKKPGNMTMQLKSKVSEYHQTPSQNSLREIHTIVNNIVGRMSAGRIQLSTNLVPTSGGR